MHQLGKIFVERVLDIRRRHSEGSETVVPGESLEFLAQIRGWQSEARAQRRAHLMRLSEIGLRVELEGAAGSDVFLVPKEHFAGETPEHGDEGWRYRVRSVIRCGNAMSERNALGFRHTNGSDRSLPRVRCVPQKRVWAEGQQASAAEPITGDTRSTTDLPGTPEPHRANEERPERKDLIWMKTKRQILLGANVGG